MIVINVEEPFFTLHVSKWFDIPRLAIIRLILQTEAEPNAGNGEGDGVIHLAGLLDQELGEPIILLLLEYGALGSS